MVNTRSSRANEPLDSLETPTKKQGKLKHRKRNPPSEELTKKIALTPSTKRAYDQTTDPTESPAKRTRCDGGDYIFQYMRGEDAADESEDDSSRPAPPKSLAESIRRERRERAERKNRDSLHSKSQTKPYTPRPGSIRARTKIFQEEVEQQKQAELQHGTDQTHARSQRDERSAAPEPETPRTGLFGSLRNLGNRALSTITAFTPLANKVVPAIHEDQSRSPLQPQTEPSKRPSRKPAWEIEYPMITPLKEMQNTPTYRRFGVVPESAKVDNENDSESDRKRKAFVRKWGEPDPRYDHLHLIPLEGSVEDLPYPPRKKATFPEPTLEASENDKAYYRARKARREALLGKAPVEELPIKAPLFGPNSHWLRKTRAPEIQQFSIPSQRPPTSNDIGSVGSKRKFAPDVDALDTSDLDKQQSMQPTVEDDPDSPARAQEDPTTPAAKKQKVSELFPQTPRSAMKAPGSLGRSGRNVAFNNNPVSSVRKFTPIYGDRRAGDRPFVPGSPFNTITEELQYAEAQKNAAGGSESTDSPASVASTESYSVSPTTFANTRANRGVHPGDALTQALNSTLPRVQYTWNDPYDPKWRPSLANPEPGTFRYVFEGEEDDELDQLADLEELETGTRPEKSGLKSDEDLTATTPPQPSTPRMSHAELPKPPTGALTVPGAGPLEAANLERRRAEAAKTKPRMGSRLSEVTSARSRSPSPPPLDASASSDDNESEKTPSPTLPSTKASQPTWIWTDETNEYICSDPAYPDFAYNEHGELIPSFCLRISNGIYDDTLVGPDDMTEAGRQKHLMAKWVGKETFDLGAPQTYEDGGCGTKFIHDLLRLNEKKNGPMFEESYSRMEKEWNAHQAAIQEAATDNRELVATYPDREWTEEQMDEAL